MGLKRDSANLLFLLLFILILIKRLFQLQQNQCSNSLVWVMGFSLSLLSPSLPFPCLLVLPSLSLARLPPPPFSATPELPLSTYINRSYIHPYVRIFGITFPSVQEFSFGSSSTLTDSQIPLAESFEIRICSLGVSSADYSDYTPRIAIASKVPSSISIIIQVCLNLSFSLLITLPRTDFSRLSGVFVLTSINPESLKLKTEHISCDPKVNLKYLTFVGFGLATYRGQALLSNAHSTRPLGSQLHRDMVAGIMGYFLCFLCWFYNL